MTESKNFAAPLARLVVARTLVFKARFPELWNAMSPAKQAWLPQIVFGCANTETWNYTRCGWKGSGGQNIAPSILTGPDNGIGIGQNIHARTKVLRRLFPDNLTAFPHWGYVFMPAAVDAMLLDWSRAKANFNDLDALANFWPGDGGGGFPHKVFTGAYEFGGDASALQASDLGNGYKRAGARKMCSIFFPQAYMRTRGTRTSPWLWAHNPSGVPDNDYLDQGSPGLWTWKEKWA